MLNFDLLAFIDYLYYVYISEKIRNLRPDYFVYIKIQLFGNNYFI